MIQRGGQVVIKMLSDVKQRMIKPLITETIAPGAMVMTDEYDIYAKLPECGYGHKTVCHSKHEFAREEDGDGFCEQYDRRLLVVIAFVVTPAPRHLSGVAAGLSRFL